MWLVFTPPVIGQEFKWRKRTFRCVGVQEREIGYPAIDWRSRCPVCKSEYTFRTYANAITPRSICGPCLAKPRIERPGARVSVLAAPKRKPSVEEIVFAVGELPWDATASLARNAVAWAPKLLRKHSARMRAYTFAEINAGLTDAILAGRVRHEAIGWNKWHRPMYGLRAYSEEQARERQVAEGKKILAGGAADLFD